MSSIHPNPVPSLESLEYFNFSESTISLEFEWALGCNELMEEVFLMNPMHPNPVPSLIVLYLWSSNGPWDVLDSWGILYQRVQYTRTPFPSLRLLYLWSSNEAFGCIGFTRGNTSMDPIHPRSYSSLWNYYISSLLWKVQLPRSRRGLRVYWIQKKEYFHELYTSHIIFLSHPLGDTSTSRNISTFLFSIAPSSVLDSREMLLP